MATSGKPLRVNGGSSALGNFSQNAIQLMAQYRDYVHEIHRRFPETYKRLTQFIDRGNCRCPCSCSENEPRCPYAEREPHKCHREGSNCNCTDVGRLCVCDQKQKMCHCRGRE